LLGDTGVGVSCVVGAFVLSLRGGNDVSWGDCGVDGFPLLLTAIPIRSGEDMLLTMVKDWVTQCLSDRMGYCLRQPQACGL
jgi:hypothetical protein